MHRSQVRRTRLTKFQAMDALAVVKNACDFDGYYHGRKWTSTAFSNLAVNIGPPRAEARDQQLVRKISPQDSAVAPHNTLSSRYGAGSFPPHTDTAYWRQPARYVLFRCVNAGKARRVTRIFYTRDWQLSRADESLLCRAVWKVKAVRPFLASFAQRKDDQLLFRFDLDCMVPMSNDAQAALDLFRSCLVASRQITIDWSEGDVLVIDNWRCIHARGMAIVRDEDRVLERILVGEKL